MKRTLVALALLLLVVPAAGADTITSLHNTGLAAVTQVDPYWYMASATAIIRAYVTDSPGFPFGYWMGNSAASKWISPQSSYVNGQTDLQNTSFLYNTTFGIAPGYNPDSAWFTMRLLVDNQVEDVLLNGHSLGITWILGNPSTYSSFGGPWSDTFTVDEYFQSGSNTLSFNVRNAAGASGNPTGLRVEFLDSHVVPEPATLTLLGLGLAGAYRASRRRK